MDTLLKVDELAHALGVGRTRAYQMISNGEIPVVRLGRSIRVSSKILEEWIRTRSELQPTAGS